MPRSYPSHITTAYALGKTRPIWLIQLGFSTVRRYSSREQFTFQANTFTAQTLRVRIALNGLVGAFSLYNDDASIGDDFYNNGQGIVGVSVQAWMSYGDPTLDSHWEQMFDGEINGGRIGRWITCKMVQPQLEFTPRQIISAADFNHLPPEGTELTTNDGIIVLGRTT